MPDFFPEAAQMLMRDEGFRAHPYFCTEGALTVGYGRNLDSRGISQEEAEMMLVHDMLDCLSDLETFQWWGDLNDARKSAVLNMRFQLGARGFRGFRKTIHFLSQKLYTQAAQEALNSRWAKQTPERAHRIARIIDEGRL